MPDNWTTASDAPPLLMPRSWFARAQRVGVEATAKGALPVAIEQDYATAQWIVREGAANQIDPERIAVAGDSVGGGMTAALALLNPLSATHATRAAVAQAIATLRQALHTA